MVLDRPAIKPMLIFQNDWNINSLPSQTKYNLPSWCDRVLRRSYPLVHVFCQSYGETTAVIIDSLQLTNKTCVILVHVITNSIIFATSLEGCTNDIMTSDHSPVFSTFEVGVSSQFVSKHGTASYFTRQLHRAGCVWLMHVCLTSLYFTKWSTLRRRCSRVLPCANLWTKTTAFPMIFLSFLSRSQQCVSGWDQVHELCCHPHDKVQDQVLPRIPLQLLRE